MIRGFRNKGLQRLYEKDERRGLPAASIDKIERLLARLDVATGPEQMNLPGLKLHPLKGDLKGFWAVWLTGNWRIVFGSTVAMRRTLICLITTDYRYRHGGNESCR